MYDFLIDVDNNSFPDSIMDSACNDEPITVVYAAGSNTPTLDNPVLNVTISGSTQGWGYMSVTDPIRNEYPILKIVRSDGEVLSRYNYWMQENTIYFVDYNPSDKYRIVYKVPLLISNMHVTDLSTESARISWDTDRLSDNIVKYGTKPGIYTDQKKNVTDTVSHSINLNELADNTTYYFVVNSTHPSGNTNESTELNFTTLQREDSIQVMNPSANPALILNDNGRIRQPGTNITQLNVTVIGNAAIVTIDLSPIGGAENAQMTKISGTENYTIYTNATIGMNLTNYLVVNATGTSGNYNNSVGVQVTVLLRGDIVRDNKIDLKDLLYMRRNIAGLEPSINTLVADIQPAVGDGKVDLKDLLFLRLYIAGLEPVI